MIMRFIWAVTLVFGLLVPVLAKASTHVATQEMAIQLAVKAMQQYHLSSRPAECISFDVDGKSPKFFLVDMREIHNAKCGGDPATLPELYVMKVQQANGAVSVYDAIADDYYPAASYLMRVHQEEAGDK